VNADVQRIRYSDAWVYVNASGLASHVMGPWYNPAAATGLFPNNPHDQQSLNRFSRNPQEASAKTTNQLGSLGMWVNDVALFNMLDGASWSNAMKSDQMGGGPPQAAVQVAEGEAAPVEAKPIPADAIRITVSSSGYSPARIEVQKGQATSLRFSASMARIAATRL